MNKTFSYAAVWLLASAVAACEQTETADTGADTTALETRTGDTTAAVTDARVDTVHVVLDEWTVRPASSTHAPGRVVFHVMNEGEYAHALEVEGNGEEKETDEIQPGGTGTVEVELRAGTYELYCPVEDTHGKHEQLGMRTTLTVR